MHVNIIHETPRYNLKTIHNISRNACQVANFLHGASFLFRNALMPTLFIESPSTT